MNEFPKPDDYDDPWTGPTIHEMSDHDLAGLRIKFFLIGLALGTVVSQFVSW